MVVGQRVRSSRRQAEGRRVPRAVALALYVAVAVGSVVVAGPVAMAFATPRDQDRGGLDVFLAVALPAVIAVLYVLAGAVVLTGARGLWVGPAGAAGYPQGPRGPWRDRPVVPEVWDAFTAGVDWARTVPPDADYRAWTRTWRRTRNYGGYLTSIAVVAEEPMASGATTEYLHAVMVLSGTGSSIDIPGAAFADAVSSAAPLTAAGVPAPTRRRPAVTVVADGFGSADGTEHDSVVLELPGLRHPWRVVGDAAGWLNKVPATSVVDVLNTHARPGLRLTVGAGYAIAWLADGECLEQELEAVALDLVAMEYAPEVYAARVGVPAGSSRGETRRARAHRDVADLGRLRTRSVARGTESRRSALGFFGMALAFFAAVSSLLARGDATIPTNGWVVSLAQWVGLLLAGVTAMLVTSDHGRRHGKVAGEIRDLARERGWSYAPGDPEIGANVAGVALRAARRVSVLPVARGIDAKTGWACAVAYGEGDRGVWPLMRLQAVTVVCLDPRGVGGPVLPLHDGETGLAHLRERGFHAELSDGVVMVWADAADRGAEPAALVEYVVDSVRGIAPLPGS